MDGNQIRQEYLLAREIVAKELIEKYHLIESYRDDERLTLDGINYSIHLTFYLPDGDDVYLTKKGNLPSWDTSFYSYPLKKFPDEGLRKLETTKLFKPISHFEHFDYSLERLTESFKIQAHFLNAFLS